ncbi:MAG: hypothetical protein K6E79_03420 [Pseudobutyrivibrio sp.]|nr:hypothetical protein [Pseudobutyrivibrio sp.]
MDEQLIEADVICEHKTDSSIIPIRFRIVNNQGENQIFNVKKYRQAPKLGTYKTKDGVFVSNQTEVFECQVEILGIKKMVRLYYEPEKDKRWFLGIN